MRISDELMWRYIELLSFEDQAKIAAKKKAVQEGSNPRDVKFDFASEIVERFHGRKAALAAARAFDAQFRGGALPDDIQEMNLSWNEKLTFPQLLKLAGLVPSTSEANRVIEQGGVKVDGSVLSDRALQVERGKTYLLQVGKRRFARVRLA
jgi:tyrosyl-tRNA synthetase